MPKRATHTFESEKDGLKEEKLGINYCMCCGESVLILGEKTVLADTPRRRTDGAHVLERGVAVFRLNVQDKGVRLLKRAGGYERQYRFGCWNCGVLIGYRCEEGGVDARLTYLLADATGGQADLYLAMYHVPPSIQPAGPLSVRVALNVSANQPRRAVRHVNEEEVGVAVVAQAREGLANAELLEYMAKVLGVARARLHLSRGWSHASKYLLVSGLQPVQIFKRLKAAIETEAISFGPVAGVNAPAGNTEVGPAATAGAASFAARRHWEEGEELDDLAEAPTKKQQTFIK